MTKLIGVVRVAAAVTLLPVMLVQQSLAWGKDGHTMINRLAGAALPADVPEFLRSTEALDALEYYGPEPDRWKSPGGAGVECGAVSGTLYRSRVCRSGGRVAAAAYDFVRALAFAQKAHPDLPLSPEKVGMQPYQAVEVWERLEERDAGLSQAEG